MKIVNVSQRDEDWLDWRRDGITGTDAIVLMDRSPYKTRWRLWAEKTGYCREVDLSMNPLVRHGVENEDNCRQCAEKHVNDLLLPACAESSVNPIFRASLDGLMSTNQPVELKCPSESVWEDVCENGVGSKAYYLYYVQVQHQLLVTGALSGYLVFWYEGDIRVFHISRDEALLKELQVRALQFWQQVRDRDEPMKDPERDLFLPKGKVAQQWICLAEEYRLYDAEIQLLKQRLDELKAKQAPLIDGMKSLMGEFNHAEFAGVMLTRYKAAGKVDYGKLLREKAGDVSADDIERYRGKTTERCRVTVTGSVKPRQVEDEAVLAPLENVPDKVESHYF